MKRGRRVRSGAGSAAILAMDHLPALVAISGGRDSVALLHLLVTAGHRQLILCHLNHGLRGHESGHDAAFVRRLALRYDLPCEIGKADIAKIAAARSLSIETAGRLQRHDFFFETALKHQVSHIYLAHHADDQAETILANLCRGAALSGLTGMKSESQLTQGKRSLTLLRPLLTWQRSDIDAYITEHRLRYREDSSNVSLEHRRNRLRHEVLPLLREVFDRDVAPIISRFGVQAARDEGALRLAAQLLAETHIQMDGSLSLSRDLRSQHPAILSRVLRLWLVETLKLSGIDTRIIDTALALLQPGGPAKVNLPGDHHLRRKAARLWVK